MQNAIPEHRINVCICTYNRLDYLKGCIQSLIPQLQADRFTLTVIDNNSTDGTKEFVERVMSDHAEVHYFLEPKQGLSHARNAAMEVSEFEWVFYLDDDCLPSSDLLMNALHLINQNPNLHAIGGPVDALYKDPKPDWVPEGFGTFSMPFEKCTVIDSGFVRGGCFLIHREVLSSMDGFNDRLGVTGSTLQYGEEIELQIRMRSAGYQIAYAPALRIGHFVRTEKLSILWVLHSEYARRRDKMLFQPTSLLKASLHLIRTLIGRLFWFPYHIGEALFRRSYSFKKAFYQTAQPLAFRLGEWVGVIKNIAGYGIPPGS